jgi:hypothetical protein
MRTPGLLQPTIRSWLCGVAFAVAAAAQAGGEAPKFTGPGSCSSPSCHGSVRPRTENAVPQNEYSTWAVLDKHSHAASVLTSDVGKRMGRILGVQPERSAKCLDCHSLNAAEAQKARTFDANDGVSCESCHGPASNWLGPHTTRGWSHERSLEQGMNELRDPVKRTETCLSCHLGTASKWVDHEMIAAGHPDLYFELASFSAAMPKHWTERSKDPWEELRLLATGEAVQLRENLRRIAREAARFWPEYSELDCFACHHGLTGAKDNWRQERGYAGRRPGNPAWNASRWAVLKVILEQVSREDGRRLEGDLTRVSALVSDVTADRRQLAAAALSAGDAADEAARRIAGFHFDAPAALALMKRISGAGDWISGQGERSAEQATMVLNSLVIAYCGNRKDEPGQVELKAAVKSLFQLVENPGAYNPASFAGRLRAFRAQLR